jgi:hypothetical protein
MHDHPIAKKTNKQQTKSFTKEPQIVSTFFSFPRSVLQNPPTLFFFFFFFLVSLVFTKESNTTTGEIDTLADSS